MKVHLVTTDFPLVERSVQYAACGQIVVNAAIAYTWDEQPMGQVPEIKFGCGRCQRELQAAPTRRYLYGIYDAKQFRKRKVQDEADSD
jgi:hypothetical protein